MGEIFVIWDLLHFFNVNDTQLVFLIVGPQNDYSKRTTCRNLIDADRHCFIFSRGVGKDFLSVSQILTGLIRKN